MKILKNLFPIFTLSVILLISCEDDDNYQRYEQEVISIEDGALTYTNLTSYPVVGTIESVAPVGKEFETPMRFRLLDVISTTESSFVKGSFSVAPETGSVIYNNSANSIKPGVYSVDVGLANTNGMAVFSEAFELTILPVPVTVNLDNNNVDTGIFEQGVIATVSYTDTSNTGAVTSVSYDLIEPPNGFEINTTTGAISKVNGAASGPNRLSVRLTTNAGILEVQNVLTVNVGDPPTIKMMQQDGTTLLTKAVLSPNTAYTTAPPVVDGMSPTQWELIFPKSLFNDDPDLSVGETAIDFSGAFGIENPSGRISISADAGLPLGMHTLSLKAINASGNEYVFEDIFNIHIEERWDSNPLYENDLSALGNQIELHELNGSQSIMGSTGNHGKAISPVVKWQTLNNNTNRKDGAMEINVPISASIKKVRLSFYEAFGYNNFFVARHARELSSYQAGDASDPPLTPDSWEMMMEADDSSWSGTHRWQTIGPDISTFNKISDKSVDIQQGTQKLYFFIRLYRMADKDPIQGQWLIRNILIESSSAFTAEEQ